MIARPGELLSHYRLVEKIGEGGMGQVYLALDERLRREVALKVLSPGVLSNETTRKRFRNEALALSRLNHPSIATIHDFDTHEDVDFLVMENVPGETLRERLTRTALSEKDISSLGRQLAEGLTAAHEKGIVHRDLKPTNLRITPDGRLKILDFGLAKTLQETDADSQTETMIQTGGIAGTIPYMAPEQLRGEPADERSDIFSLGIVLYEMATGQRPFRGKTAPQVIGAILNDPPDPPRAVNSKLSPGLDRIIMKCIRKAPEGRYQSVRDILVDLQDIDSSGSSSRVGRFVSFPTNRVLQLAATIALIAVPVSLVILNVGGSRDRIVNLVGKNRIESIAVLPLVNLSNDPEQEYFVDGMTEELIAGLSRINALKVISRTSVMRYKGTEKTLPEIAGELGVDAVIEGSVLREGNRVRITAQLIDADTDRHLWVETYERDMRDVLALQNDVSRAIAREIRITLTPEETARHSTSETVDPEAYQAYLKGLYFWNQWTRKGLEKSTDYFREAIEKDPTYARAHAALADSYTARGVVHFLRPRDAYPQARAAAMTALGLDDTLAAAHVSLGLVKYRFDWDWAGAEREFERALELNPGNALAYLWYADYLTSMGRHEEAVAAARRARELDPLSAFVHHEVGWTLMMGRQYDRAIEEFQATLEMDPNHAAVHHFLDWTYRLKGLDDLAFAEREKAARLGGTSSEEIAAMRRAYQEGGIMGFERRRLERLLEDEARGFVNAARIAGLYAGLGEVDKSFEWFEKAYEQREDGLVFFKVAPWYDVLRPDPRYEEMMRRLGLPLD